MRRTLALAVVVASVSVFAGTVTADAASVHRFYRGTTSAGGDITFTTAVSNGHVRLEEVGLSADAACEDGTTFSFSGGIGFGRGPVIVSGVLELDQRFFDQATLVSGTLGSRRGSGTIRQVYAALDANEEPQVCDTGDLSWTVSRVERRARALRGSTVLEARARGISSTLVTERVAAASIARPTDVRTYRGRIAPAGSIGVATARTDAGGVKLVEFDVGWELACDDGSTFDIGVDIFFGGGEPMDPGRLDLDDVGMGQALHVHGRLGPHAGDGTTSMIFPILTDDLRAQGCRSGDRTWRAWRTDPGAIRV